MTCPLFIAGPVAGSCRGCGQPVVAHALPPTLAPDPFAAWCALPSFTRALVVDRVRAAGDLGPVITAADRAWDDGHRAAADALEALAAGRRP